MTGGSTGLAAVTGATGCIGRALVARLTEHGPVRALCRTTNADPASARAGVEIVTGDLDRQPALDALVRGADVVYHCAASMAKSDPRASERINVAGTERLAHAALRAGVRHFVYVSSISVFAATRRNGEPITETVEPAHVDRLNAYSRTKLAGEHVVRRLAREGLRYSIIRPTNVYGPWSRPWFLQWARLLRRTPFVIGDITIDVVYVDDVAGALIQAARTEAAVAETFHVGHEAVTLHEFVRRVGVVVNRRVRRVPRAIDRAIRRAIEGTYLRFTGTHMSLSLSEPAVYPHDKARRMLGYRPAYDLDRGFRALSEWYRTS